MAKTAAKPRTMTVEEFLDWDGGGHVGKLELVEGEVRTMSPASGDHAIIQANLAVLIGSELKSRKGPCRVGTEAPVIPRLHSRTNLRAPDVAVTCLPAGEDQKFPDPVFIAGVMSPGNMTETWEAITACTTIPSLRDIIVVESTRVEAVLVSLDDEHGWPREGVRFHAGDKIDITSLELTLELAAMYEGTTLA